MPCIWQIIQQNNGFSRSVSLQKALELGRAEVLQANDEYQQGLVDNRALIDAQQSLADAELDALHTIYNFAVSRLALARSLGRVERILE